MHQAKNGLLRRPGYTRALLFFALLLSLAVVFWGLHDKVSLYKHTGAAPPVAKAKLLSGRDLGTAQATSAAVEPLVLASFFVLLWGLLLSRYLPSSRWEACFGACGPPFHHPAFSQSLHRRPPPLDHSHLAAHAHYA